MINYGYGYSATTSCERAVDAYLRQSGTRTRKEGWAYARFLRHYAIKEKRAGR